ncbi:MAG: glycerol-3-phosphate cytidylyltransferase [Oscillospiraceae bacterium]|jgi:glycerol-3-phosphate cytidylyltransferase|nr:glycerol-3-phosphate cytidylyltransferase [Oscillospiraceae bacterium]
MKRVLTYGTFDLLHYGHIELLRRARAEGDCLIVALSTDEFNALKGKKAYHSYEIRKRMLEAICYVDKVIPEENWEQKPSDVRLFEIDTVVMGDDWKDDAHFTAALNGLCRMTFLPRTPGISTSDIKKDLKLQKPVDGVSQLPGEPE